MKHAKKLGCIALGGLLTVSGLCACNPETPPAGDQTYDPETRPFTMSIGALDGNFNPFFYTAQNDGTVVGLTQVSMLASDAEGNAVVGEDRPTVAKDFDIVERGSGDSLTTEYSFLIKNGMKYSDGNDLTVMDVLFNLYVYLDEAYVGSNTLYSTDIQGLKAYRAQDASLSDDADNDTSATFYADASARITDIITYCSNKTPDDEEQVKKDILTVIEMFKNEVKSDWTSVENSFTSRDVDTYEYRFTEAWEAYLFNEGIVSVQVEKQQSGATTPKKDANGKYLTTLDEEGSYYRTEIEAYYNNATNIAKYTATGATEALAKEYLKRDWAINFVYGAKTGADYDTKLTSIDGVAISKTGVSEIVQYWATGSDALEKFAAEERAAYYAGQMGANGELAVSTVSGITVQRVTSFKGKDLGEAHDVLKIVINDVDPKAIWNFAFTVAPMHYYSEGDLITAANADYQNYLDAYARGEQYSITKFGVKFSDPDFFGDEGLQKGDKSRLPVGAGSYKASKASGGDGTAAGFHANKFVYYERNTYFETMGAELNNAIIKTVKYKEVGDDQVITNLTQEEIDYGMPSGNAENSVEIAKYHEILDTAKYDSNGYGYVGINPKFVPDVEVRRAIMMAMNTTSTVNNYYTQEWAQVIYRPISKTSWAYPTGVGEYESIKYTNQASVINNLIQSAGYSINGNGIWEKNDKPLKLTFTIAGNSKEHPAFQMFTDAEAFLEANCHMDITVATDIQALKKLATGNLAVWAAAWTSAIDPDMYQVYHKDSKATSVKNWNYGEITVNADGKWDYENAIVTQLSELIDLARKTNVKNDRKRFYSQALDLVMDLAVELPTYQRKDYEVYNKKYIDRSSLTETPSSLVSLIDRIWEVNYN